MSTTIAIVEDNREISDLLISFLKENNYETISADDGIKAEKMLKEQKYDLVLMDLMLPGKSGGELIKGLRTYSQVPIIVLSAKSMMETRLEMLRLGADDYILKPFNFDEVLVRIEVVLRRSTASREGLNAGEQPLEYKGLCYYPQEQRLVYGDQPVSLTAKELKILELLLRYPKKTYSKANLYEAVWNDVYYYEDNTINVHVSNLKKKLKNATGQDFIETVWGIGYRLKE